MKLIYLTMIPVLAYSLYMLYSLWLRDEYSNIQKVAQSILIICLPLLGSVIIHAMIREFDRVLMPRNPNDGMGHDEPSGGAG